MEIGNFLAPLKAVVSDIILRKRFDCVNYNAMLTFYSRLILQPADPIETVVWLAPLRRLCAFTSFQTRIKTYNASSEREKCAETTLIFFHIPVKDVRLGIGLQPS